MADERGHAERAENQADKSPQESDHDAPGNHGPHTSRPSSRHSTVAAGSDEGSHAEVDEDDTDYDEQGIGGQKT